jgi:hypothetical protein
MKIKSIKSAGRRLVYDLSVNSDDYDNQHYILENGVINHNTGSYYSADNIFILGRQQDKDGSDIVGYNFIINVEKSRYVKEKSKIPVSVTYEGGISKWSGLLDIALESGHVIKPKVGWYQKVNKDGEIEQRNYREKDTNNKEFWESILKQESFYNFVCKKYMISKAELMDDEIVQTFEGENDD